MVGGGGYSICVEGYIEMCPGRVGSGRVGFGRVASGMVGSDKVRYVGYGMARPAWYERVW